MNTPKRLCTLLASIICVFALGACNQTQQQSAGMPGSSGGSGTPGGSSGGGMPGSSSPGSSGGGMPGSSSPGSSGGGSSSGGTASLPGGGGLPGGGLPGGSSLPSGGGLPGSNGPSGTPGGNSGTPTGTGDGGQGRPGSPGDESPFPGSDRDGDGIPDTAQSGSESDDVTFSESTGGPAASREEQVASLDEELDGSMRDYDGRILEERAGVMGRASQRGSEEQLEDFDRSLTYYEEADLSEDDIPTNEEAPSGRSSEATGNVPTSGRTKDIVTPPPDDIPSGDDDDVVARQIREAASKETDPDLREALWEEYRKYKNQSKR